MTDHFHELVEHHLRMFLPGRVVGLVTDGLHSAVDTEPVGTVHDQFGGIGVSEVHRGCTEPFGKRQPVGFLVDHKNLRDTALCAAISPTEPAQNTATVSPAPTWASSVPWLTGGK
ncbi:MAG: hypothetical protein ACRDQG_10385, partial [Pseudonocardiaceae bacterium]